MPKNSSTEILKRWKAMDADLGRPASALHVRLFARKWKVSIRTVHRDLAAFRMLGQRMVCQRDPELMEYYFRYELGAESLFVSNSSPGLATDNGHHRVGRNAAGYPPDGSSHASDKT